MPIINHISADSKAFIRGKFKACFGVSLAFEDVKSFKERYYTFFEKIKNDFNIKNNPRIVFKSYDLKTIFPYKKFPDIADRFIGEVITEDVRVNVVFSSFNTQRLPKVRYYGGEMKTLKFLDKLQTYYSYIPVWKVIQYRRLFGVNIFIDNFNESEETDAWRCMKNNQNRIHVVPKGDQCNPLISTADILLEYLDYAIKANHVRLDVCEIQKLLQELGISYAYVIHVGSRDITKLVPMSKDKIPKKEDYHHPIVYVIPEGVIEKEKEWIERSRIYQYLLWYAWYIGGGLKFISSDKDYKLVDKQDHLVYLGKIGENKARYLSEVLDYTSNVIGINEIIEMTKR